VIALHEALLVERVEMKHTLPDRRMVFAGCAVRLERDVRHGLMVCYYLQVVARQISLVRAHFSHRKIAASGLNQSLKLRTVGNVRISNLDAGYDVRCRSAHQVNFDPFVPVHQAFIAVLRLRPLDETASRKAGRINGKRRFDALQRQTANLNQLFQERCQSWILKNPLLCASLKSELKRRPETVE